MKDFKNKAQALSRNPKGLGNSMFERVTVVQVENARVVNWEEAPISSSGKADIRAIKSGCIYIPDKTLGSPG